MRYFRLFFHMMSSKCSVFYIYTASECDQSHFSVQKPHVLRATILVSVTLDDLIYSFNYHTSQINIFETTFLKYSFLKC